MINHPLEPRSDYVVKCMQKCILVAGILVGISHVVSGADSFHCPGAQLTPAQRSARAAPGALRWGAGAHTVVTYSFIAAPYTEEDESDLLVSPLVDGQGEFPANARLLVRNSFLAWSAVTDIRFVEVTEPQNIGQIRIGVHGGFTGSVVGHGFFPPNDGMSNDGVSGDFHLRTDHDWDEASLFSTSVHEIGHTLGLNHILIDAEVSHVIMYAVSLAGATERLTILDKLYAQSVYGPPLPTILPVTGGDALLVAWHYNSDPFVGATFDPNVIDVSASGQPPVAKYAGTLTRCGDVSCVSNPAITDPNKQDDDVIITNETAQALSAFEIQTVGITLQSISDGAEDSETRLFDDTAQDADTETANWTRGTDVRGGGVDKAYQITNVTQDAPFGNVQYSLPLLTDVEATANTTWRFGRAFSLSDADNTDPNDPPQRLEYRVLGDNGILLFSCAEIGGPESGDSITDLDYTEAPIRTDPTPLPTNVQFINNRLDIHLGAYAGQRIKVEYRFMRGLVFQNAEEIFLDDIGISNILLPAGSYATVSNSIPPTSSSFRLASAAANQFELRMRSVYDGGGSGAFTLGSRRTLNSALTIVCPPDITIRAGESTSTSHTGEIAITSPCGDNTTVDIDDVTGTEPIAGTSRINRTWTATDTCSSSRQCTQIIRVVSEVYYDIDSNGALDALTDGLLILRYISGIRGSDLIEQAVAADCARCTHAEIEAYLAMLAR